MPQEIADVAAEQFADEKVDAVYLVYNEFKSVMQQRVVVGAAAADPARADLNEVDAGRARGLHLRAGRRRRSSTRCCPATCASQVWRALLESAAAENAARMTAMDAATKNATDMIDGLTLYMNKVRQAAITREIIEVVSGAQAL